MSSARCDSSLALRGHQTLPTKHGCQIAIQSPPNDCSCAEDVLKSNPSEQEARSPGTSASRGAQPPDRRSGGRRTADILRVRLERDAVRPTRRAGYIQLSPRTEGRRSRVARHFRIQAPAAEPRPHLIYPRRSAAARFVRRMARHGSRARASERESARPIDYPPFRPLAPSGSVGIDAPSCDPPGEGKRAGSIDHPYTLLLLLSGMPARGACYSELLREERR